MIAEEIMEVSEAPLIATGISPTGIIHVGSLREAITGESIRSAIESKGKDVRLIYIIDSFDPLRKCYDFLPAEYEKYVGMPICRIPCPCGQHRDYAHHFVQPFLDAVDSLGVKCEIIWTHELYEQGRFAECIDKAFAKRGEVIRILHEVTGKEARADYAPYNPICEECGRFTQPIFDTYEFPYVEYACTCGHRGRADVRRAEGKLTWRLEWPAKWMIFGTSAEPFGKDHAAAGGSYDSGKRIVSEIYGGRAPFPVPYEFVQLKGVGQMHKSLGCSVTGLDAINMTPPEVLNYLFLRVNPSKAIDYDSGLGMLDMADEYDRMERLYFSGEWTESEENSVNAYRIAQHNHVPESLPYQVPYRHLVNVVQMAPTFDEVLEVLSRTQDISSMTEEDRGRIERRVSCVRYWLNGFAPDSVKFSILQTLPEGMEISMVEKAFFQALVVRMNDCVWDSETISEIISDISKSQPVGSKGGFRALYTIFIGKPAGPRIGPFLASMDKRFVINRLIQASRRSPADLVERVCVPFLQAQGDLQLRHGEERPPVAGGVVHGDPGARRAHIGVRAVGGQRLRGYLLDHRGDGRAPGRADHRLGLAGELRAPLPRLAADDDQERPGPRGRLDRREPAPDRPVALLGEVAEPAGGGVQRVHGQPGPQRRREGVEAPLPDEEDAVRRVRDRLGGGTVASEYLPRVAHAAVAGAHQGGLPEGLQDPADLGDQIQVLDGGDDPDPVREGPQGLRGRSVQGRVGARLHEEHVRARPHGRDGRVAVVHECIRPSGVVEEVAGAVARAPCHDDGRPGPASDEFGNFRGSGLQALRKLDGDGGEPPLRHPSGDPLQLQVEHRPGLHLTYSWPLSTSM